MDLGLSGKVALVTAASSGIGLATARCLAEEGASVAINARSEDGLTAAAKQIAEIATPPARITAHAADLSRIQDTDQLFDEVEEVHGGLDVLVVNTGGPPLRPFLETTLDDWSAAYELLLRPGVQLAQRAAASMAPRGGGSIVFLTSTWVKQPKAGGVLSAAMRSAVSALSKQLAGELAPHRIRVNQVLPGATATPRMQRVISAQAEREGVTVEQARGHIVADIPIGRWGEPGEIAAAVAFLASERSSYITGAALQVDGGSIRSTV